jgi:hypothetical protein
MIKPPVASMDQIKHLVSERALTGETMLLNMGPQLATAT